MNVYESLSSDNIKLLEEGTYYYLCDMLSNTRDEIIDALQDDVRMELLTSAITVATIALGKNIHFLPKDGDRCPLCNYPVLEPEFRFDICQHCNQIIDKESDKEIELILMGDTNE